MYAGIILSIIGLILDWSIIEHNDKCFEHNDFTTKEKAYELLNSSITPTSTYVVCSALFSYCVKCV